MSKEEWIIYRNWIEFTKNQKEISLGNIKSLQEFIKILEGLQLELSIDSCANVEKTIFYIIEPHYVKKYSGYIKESEGKLWIDDYELVEQIPYTFRKEVSNGRDEDGDYDNPYDAILTSLLEDNAYLINGLDKNNIYRYLEKDIDGKYMPILEVNHYLKIRRQKQITNKVAKVYQLLNASVINI